MINEIMDGLEREGIQIDTNSRSEYKQILIDSGNWTVPQTKTESEIWNSLEERINTSGAKTIGFQPWLKWAASIAIIATLAASLFILNPEVEYYSADNLKELSLPDGSTVLLGANSKMSFSQDLFGDRKVELVGMAYFDVTKGDDFLIETPNGKVSVLGTSFNVNSFANNLRVECFTGKVSVDVKDDKVILTPGLSVSYENGALNEAKPFDTEQGKSWTEGEFFYENVSVSEIFGEIERQYKVTISIEGIDSNRRYSGLFNSSDDLETTLKSVCLPMRLKYELTGDHSYKVIE